VLLPLVFLIYLILVHPESGPVTANTSENVGPCSHAQKSICCKIAVLAATKYPHLVRILRSEEWSFAAVILIGQAVRKRNSAQPNSKLVVLLLFMVMIAVMVNIDILEAYPSEPNGCQILGQLVMFVASLVVFVLSGHKIASNNSDARPE
jgi:hypothetical protein